MKTCVVILNCNLSDWTNRLYESLKPYEQSGNYELMVFDNGSTGNGISKYTTYKSEENLYFGGGFNAGMQMVLEDDRYDSMLFLNNDLTIHPYNFVKTLREAMFHRVGFMTDSYHTIMTDYDIVSPCFYNVEPNGQCFWRTMHCWNSSSIRAVPFVDFQSPLISRRLLNEIKEIPVDLKYGFGIDTLFSITCKQKGYRMGVLDNVCILHHNSMTIKSGVAGLTIPEYCRRAEEGQRKFFSERGLTKEFNEVRQAGESYTAYLT